MKIKTKYKDLQLIVRVKLPSGAAVNEQELNAFLRKPLRAFLKPVPVKRDVIECVGPTACTLMERLREPITKYDFFLIVEQTVDAAQALQKNGFPWSRVLWDLEHAFFNRNTKEVLFLYLPVTNGSLPAGDPMFLIQSLLYAAKPINEGDPDYLSRFSYYLRSFNQFVPESVEAYIQNDAPDAVRIIKSNRPGGSGSLTGRRDAGYQRYGEKQNPGAAPCPLDADATSLLCEPGDLDATSLLSEPSDLEATSLLSETGWAGPFLPNAGAAPSVRRPTLLRSSTQETISVNKNVFRLGKEPGAADYCIAGNTAISRSHADIVVRGSRCFVMDLGSTNKTYINGLLLEPKVDTEIFDGDLLTLADEEFVFHF